MGLKISDILTNLVASRTAIVGMLTRLGLKLNDGTVITSAANFAEAAEALNNLPIDEGSYSDQLTPSDVDTDNVAKVTLNGGKFYTETTEVKVEVDPEVYNGNRRIYASSIEALEVTSTNDKKFLTKVRVEKIPLLNKVHNNDSTKDGKIRASQLVSDGTDEAIYSVIAPNNYTDADTGATTQAFMTQVDIEKVLLGEYTATSNTGTAFDITVANLSKDKNWQGLSRVSIPAPQKTTYAKLYNIGDVSAGENIVENLPAGFINASTITINVKDVYTALAAL